MKPIHLLPPLILAFEGVSDPRQRSGRRHPLGPMLLSAVCAILFGARGVTAIAEWTRSRSSSEIEKLGFTRSSLPCAATYWHLFEKLNTVELESSLRAYFEPVLRHETALAIDGKTLRGSRQEELAPVHLLSAFGHRTEVVFDQKWVGPKTNEIDIIIPLLAELDISGLLITADAMHTQRKTAEAIVERGLIMYWWSKAIRASF